MKPFLAGVDEVGRGCLAGPVVAAAVILKKDISGLQDSKKLSENKRIILAEEIQQNSFYSFGLSSNEEIDKINILEATLKAMKRAIIKLPVEPTKVLVDGINKPKVNFLVETIIRGDSKIKQISAASIIAKVYRDDLMKKYDKEYPEFGFIKNKGYGTKKHFLALSEVGYCPIHRKSFKGVIQR